MYVKDRKPRNFGHPSNHPLYRCWASMKNRCYNKNDKRNYEWYGARGIKVCDRWTGDNGFWNFVDDMGERPDGASIDRIDSHGDYCPENCRWATAREQALNRRTASVVEIDGKTVTAMELSEKLGISIETARRRIKRGVPKDELLAVRHNGIPRSVICIEDKKVFNSIREASKFYRMKSPCSIQSVLSGKARTAYGKHWAYADEVLAELTEIMK